jgi:hypothetical protein
MASDSSRKVVAGSAVFGLDAVLGSTSTVLSVAKLSRLRYLAGLGKDKGGSSAKPIVATELINKDAARLKRRKRKRIGGEPSNKVRATDVIWDFIVKHPLP